LEQRQHEQGRSRITYILEAVSFSERRNEGAKLAETLKCFGHVIREGGQESGVEFSYLVLGGGGNSIIRRRKKFSRGGGGLAKESGSTLGLPSARGGSSGTGIRGQHRISWKEKVAVHERAGGRETFRLLRQGKSEKEGFRG